MVYKHSLPFDGDAFDVFSVFKDQPHVFFLDSSLRKAQGRFSYIGFAPFTMVRDDWSALKKIFAKYPLPSSKLSFPAGAVGYLGYDGSLFFGFYDTILAVDHQYKRLIISSFSKGHIKDILKQLNRLAYHRVARIDVSRAHDSCSSHMLRETTFLAADRVAKRPEEHVSIKPSQDPMIRVSFKSNFTKSGYIKAIRQALEHIRRGDIYQINLSHKIKVPIPIGLEPAALYRNLRCAFPSEFGAYFDDGKQVILSASPERFLRLRNGIAQVKPMKGTRPRGKTKEEDRRLKEQLKRSPKEIAELLMVTDLERNDLGRVCDYASVKVKSMRTIETYASVFQATSTVEGRLHKDRDQFDLLKAAFPSGSVTGCPKIEAMKIIKELEHGSRGLYTGALGYISFSGDMDFNVMIRTMYLHPSGKGAGQVTFHVGGGIVADSKPQDEWQETWDKARPMIEALQKSCVIARAKPEAIF
jgi:para-aminobenzoate synthetase component 1